jgi:NAD-dependent dihydropyrimidine dehydrogenase PreA subunit
MIEISDEKCVGCGICVCLCPVDDCLTGFNDIKVAETCIDCMKCVHGCPVNAISEVQVAMESSSAAI